MKFEPEKKQHELFKTFGDKSKLQILFGGAAGGGKSYAVWALVIIKCIEYPGIKVGMARETLVQIKKNSIGTFMKIMNKWGIEEGYWKYNAINGEIKFWNGSVIQFFELSYRPKDPFYDRIGGAELTFGVIEEANGCDSRGKEVFNARLGRWKNDEFCGYGKKNCKVCKSKGKKCGIPSHLYMTTNPGTNFVYSDFYLPWVKGELEDFRTYIPAGIGDNKYLGAEYESNMYKTLGKLNASRLLRGDWNFDNDSSRLVKYNKCLEVYDDVPKDENVSSNERYLSADIAFTSDKCILIVWFRMTIKKIVNYLGEIDPETGEPDKDKMEPEKEIERLCKEYSIPMENVSYDSAGVGLYLSGKLELAYPIVSNASPIGVENFGNLKAQLYFKLADMINEGRVKVDDDSFRVELIQEIYEIRTPPIESIEGKLRIIKKDELKKIIGRSPDIADAMAYRMIFEIGGVSDDDYHVSFG